MRKSFWSKVGSILESIQIFLVFVFAIAIIVCFILFTFNTKSDWGNIGLPFLLLGVLNILVLVDRDKGIDSE